MTAPPIPLTEERVRAVFREYARLSSPSALSTMAMRSVASMAMPPERRIAAVVESLTSEPVQRMRELSVERQRAEAIARLIGLIGFEEARLQATALSTRAAAEGMALLKRPWKYTLWDYKMLDAAKVIDGARLPIQRDEVDAVARAMDELCSLDVFFNMAFRRAQEAGAALRADPTARTKRAVPQARSYEARKWLTRKRRPTTELAANRFGTTADALAFVESLYEAGATEVRIAGESIEKDEGFDHADALRVWLPKDQQSRLAILTIVNAEAAREGFDQEEDSGQKEVYLWWD
jgi:hypothetical protein